MKRTGWQIVTASVLGLSLTVTAAAQGPAGGLTSPLPFGELEKVFGQHEGFAATALVTLTATGQAKPMKLTLPMAYLNGKFRTETSCLLYTSPSPRDRQKSRMPSSA